jgi:hypothetical protein
MLGGGCGAGERVTVALEGLHGIGAGEEGIAVAGFIILSDGRAYAASNWSYDSTIDAIAEALPNTQEGRLLADWILNQRCTVQGMGLGSVDLRELTPRNQEVFLRAVEDAYRIQTGRGPVGWASPNAWPSWIGRFADLVKMIECIGKGEPPGQFNPHMMDVIPPREKKAGPGWDES